MFPLISSSLGSVISQRHTPALSALAWPKCRWALLSSPMSAAIFFPSFKRWNRAAFGGIALVRELPSCTWHLKHFEKMVTSRMDQKATDSRSLVTGRSRSMSVVKSVSPWITVCRLPIGVYFGVVAASLCTSGKDSLWVMQRSTIPEPSEARDSESNPQIVKYLGFRILQEQYYHYTIFNHFFHSFQQNPKSQTLLNITLIIYNP